MESNFISHIISELKLHRGNDVLELECRNTNGQLGESISSVSNYTGTDSDMGYIDKMKNTGKNSGNMEWFHCDCDDLKFQAKVFDVVIIVINGRRVDTPTLYRTIRECLRVAKNNGKIGFFNMDNETLLKLQAYITKHFEHLELLSKENEDKHELIISKIYK